MHSGGILDKDHSEQLVLKAGNKGSGKAFRDTI